MTREITLDDIESLAVGAWILGTGSPCGGSILITSAPALAISRVA